MPALQKRWIIEEPAPLSFKQQFPQIDPLAADLLYRRNIRTQEAIDEFLNPDYGEDLHDPFLFKQMPIAIERVMQAIQLKERITVHGDYDADGLSGAVILFSTLTFLGAEDVNVYLPDREREGYGLNANTVQYLHAQGTRLIITCDCGISNAEEINQARGLGMDVIVTDHHTQRGELPNAIILHPKVLGETYPFKELAGGGVAFKFAQGLLRTAKQGKPEKEALSYEAFEKWLLDMVAISSVADMVPLVGENRTLVKYGLTVLSKARRLGIRAILQKAGVYPPKNGKELKLTTYEVGFIIGPRLNAAGRMDHANAAFGALMAQEEPHAAVLADNLEQTNKNRQAVTEKMYKEALEQIGEINRDEPQAIVVYDPTWSVGVAGLIASRLLERFHLPVFVLAEINGQIAGSGRSIEGFDCVQALNAMKDLFLKYGGHARACGFTLADNKRLDEFKQRATAYAKKVLNEEEVMPKLVIDGEIELNRLTWDFYEQLKQFEPFGMGNPQPKFLSTNLEIVDISTVGAEGAHLRLSVTQNHTIYRKCIAFKQGKWAETLRAGDKVDLVYHLDVNEWNGNRELQLKVVEIRLATS